MIYRSSIFWSKLLAWHLSGDLWGWCEISYAYDYSSRLYDHSKSVRFEKRDIKMLATGTVFGGYFNLRDRLLWELKLFLFHWIEMKLAHKITVCVSGLEIKLTLSYQTTAKISNFEIPQLRWARSPIHTTIYEITRSTSLSHLSIKKLALLVHWWQRQAAVEDSSRGDERVPDIPPAKPCAQLSEAARRFEVELRQHWYGCSYKARCFPWCLVGTNISSTYCWAYRFS